MSGKILRSRLPVLLVFLCCFGGAEAKPGIAIIIDDLGYGLEQARRVSRLPGPVACAVLPGTPRATTTAELAHASGKEVILHLPLQSVAQTEGAEPGRIGIDTSRQQMAMLLGEYLDGLPHVSGINNHQGSLLTRHPGHMQWLMQEISDRENLFFVDSYTTKYSVAMQTALTHGIASARRDVFLDPDDDPETVAREFERALALARENGFALAIGHPYPATLDFLEKALPDLVNQGVELVSVRELIGRIPVRSAAAKAGFPASE